MRPLSAALGTVTASSACRLKPGPLLSAAAFITWT
jgi:hypothetical protein